MESQARLDACETLVGTASSVWTGAGGGWTESIAGSLLFRQDTSRSTLFYVLESGSATWSATGQIGDCSVFGAGTTVELQPGGGNLEIGLDGVYAGAVTVPELEQVARLHLVCPDGSVETPPNHYTMFGISQFDGFHISDDGRLLQGSLSYPDLEQSWNLVRCQSIRLTATPTADELIRADSTITIEWESDGVAQIDLLLSISRDKVTHHEIASGVPASDREYTWTVPDTLLARKSRIVIRDSANESIADSTEFFRIKGYQLTRVSSDGQYEPFEVSRHAWSFRNDLMILAPPSAWDDDQQFNYATAPAGTDPITGAPYSFPLSLGLTVNDRIITAAHLSPKRYVDFPSFVRAYGSEHFYITSAEGSTAYNFNGMIFWLENSRIITDTWFGACHGMVMNALTRFLNNEPDLSGRALDDASRREIMKLHVYQSGRRFVDYMKTHTLDDPRRTLEALKSRLLDKDEGHLHDAALGFYRADSVDGHSVLPIKMKRTQKDPLPTVYEIDIYDPDHGGRTVFLDSTANSFANGYWPHPPVGSVIALDPWSNYVDQAVYPGLGAGIAGKAVESEDDELRVYPSESAALRISSAAGDISYVDGTLTNDISGSHVQIPLSGSSEPPASYSLPLHDYRVSMSGYPGALSSLFVESHGTHVAAMRADAIPSDLDVFALDPDGMGIVSSDDRAKEYVLLAATAMDGADVLASVATGLSASDSVWIGRSSSGRVRLVNWGAARSYALYVHVEDGMRTLAYGDATLHFGAGATHELEWTRNGGNPDELILFVDSDSDGTPDESVEIRPAGTTAIEPEHPAVLPYTVQLGENYPNPFSRGTTIPLALSSPTRVDLSVYDTLGRLVRRLVTGIVGPGRQEVMFDAEGLPAGLYFFTLTTPDFRQTRTVVLHR